MRSLKAVLLCAGVAWACMTSPGLGAGAAARAWHDLLHAELLVLGAVAGAARRALRVSWTVWFCPRLVGVTRSAGALKWLLNPTLIELLT